MNWMQEYKGLFLSYRNQSIDLLKGSIGWFQYVDFCELNTH